LDEPLKNLGINRWIWAVPDDSNGEPDWITRSPKGEGPGKDFTIEETLGCSCFQILDNLTELTDETFDGHSKFGCSQSVLEDWIEGYYLVDSLQVPSDSPAGVTSSATLKVGQEYKLEASGTYDYWPTCILVEGEVGYPGPCRADAEYSLRPSYSHGPGWVLGDNVFPSAGYPAGALDLMVDGGNIDWGPFSDMHMYTANYVGLGDHSIFSIYDSYYGDNSGSLFVKIYVKLW
jgi:hypothetical protein